MAETDVAPKPDGKSIGSFFKQSTAGLPNWAWGLVIVGGFALAYFLPKFMNQGGKSTQPAGSDTTGLGLAIDPTTGLPYAVSGLVPSGGVVGGGGTVGMGGGGTTSTGTGGDTDSGEWHHWEDTQGSSGSSSSNISPSPSTIMHATLRSKGSRAEIKTIDARGIPVRDKPGGRETRILPYKSEVVISGSAVNGPSNLPTNIGKGSTMWYPVSGGGYISQYDVGNFASNSPGIRGWP